MNWKRIDGSAQNVVKNYYKELNELILDNSKQIIKNFSDSEIISDDFEKK